MPAPSPLSEQELRYLADQDFLTAKHRILLSLRQQLEQSQRLLQQQQASLGLPAAVWQQPPKISRGENYELLPYLVLDYPRIFKPDGVFAYRIMIRWGHEISASLHLAGHYWQHYQAALRKRLPRLQAKNWWVCVHTSPWEYHFRPDNYLPLQQLQQENGLLPLARKPFFKLSRQLPLAQYQQLPSFSLDTLRQLSRLLH
ncbi:hypothetical protein [Cesiribacter andamanensis]|uniref:Uncharacterized protein n=1 Tax=Cesiribacter andamanensis AMV16 TaxID=1279009 RepID=M7NVG9_9BACT|nr:hypothetical protein [Cesiribacter andamanensis]EMR02469.1 hypothetical protein ADICEAN_02400 [Cesiribacter andamanensis AMV16]